MNKFRYLVLVLGAASLLAGPGVMAASPSAYELGLAAAADYHYAEALRYFQTAAEQGDRDARRTLGLMLLYGGHLYGQEIVGNRTQARRWLESAAQDGCEVSTFMVKAQAPSGR